MYYYDDFLQALEEIFSPMDVVYMSDVNNGLSHEYLIALDNKGFFSEDMDIGDGVTIKTIDFDIKKRDLHYLFVQIAIGKPYLMRGIWKYLKDFKGLVAYKEPKNDMEKEAYLKLNEFLDRFKYIIVDESGMDFFVD